MMQCAIISLLALLFIPSSALAQSCAANPVAVQILGALMILSALVIGEVVPVLRRRK